MALKRPREAPPKEGTFFRLQVYGRVGISLVEFMKGKGSLSLVSIQRPKRTAQQMYFVAMVELKVKVDMSQRPKQLELIAVSLA